MPMRPAAISPLLIPLVLSHNVWSHGNDTLAIDTETNVLIARPFLITEQLVIGWPARCQDTHAAHSLVSPNEPAGSGDQRLPVALPFVLRYCFHLAHTFHALSADCSPGAAHNQP